MIPAAIVNGDEGHVGLYQSPGQQASLPKGVALITVANLIGFTTNVKGDLSFGGHDQIVSLFVVLLNCGRRISGSLVVKTRKFVESTAEA